MIGLQKLMKLEQKSKNERAVGIQESSLVLILSWRQTQQRKESWERKALASTVLEPDWCSAKSSHCKRNLGKRTESRWCSAEFFYKRDLQLRKNSLSHWESIDQQQSLSFFLLLFPFYFIFFFHFADRRRTVGSAVTPNLRDKQLSDLKGRRRWAEKRRVTHRSQKQHQGAIGRGHSVTTPVWAEAGEVIK